MASLVIQGAVGAGAASFFDNPSSRKRWSISASLNFSEHSTFRVLLMAASPSNPSCLVCNSSRNAKCCSWEPVRLQKFIARGHLFVHGNASAEATRSSLHGAANRVLVADLTKSCTPARRLYRNVARASADVEAVAESSNTGRRQVLTGVVALLASVTTTTSCALAAKAPKGFSAVLDNKDGYEFFYPFGWQEVAVKGQDVAFKDVIEPLESVSVSIVPTDKISLQELGSPDEVAKALVEKVLSSPTQKTTLKEAKARVTDGNTYYVFEFTAEARNFTRHALGTVAVKGGKFFTLTTGANERRWGKIEDKLRLVVESFTTL